MYSVVLFSLDYPVPVHHVLYMHSVVLFSLDYPVWSQPSMFYATNVAWQEHSESNCPIWFFSLKLGLVFQVLLTKTDMKFCIMLIGICVFSSKNVSKRMVSYFSPDIFYRSEILCFPIEGVYFVTFLPALTYTHTFRLFMYNVHWSQQTA